MKISKQSIHQTLDIMTIQTTTTPPTTTATTETAAYITIY